MRVQAEEVDLLELQSDDTDSLHERLIRQQELLDRQQLEIERLRNLILTSDCSIDLNEEGHNGHMPSVATVLSATGEEEISLIWTADESEADGLAASIHSALHHTLPVSHLLRTGKRVA